MILIDRLASIVTRDGEFVLATNNRALISGGPLMHAARHAHQLADTPA